MCSPISRRRTSTSRFERSLVTVRFYAGEYVSRSEARRLLARLDQFREVILDFSRVKSIGQGFADEIFRVFASAHPACGPETGERGAWHRGRHPACY